MCQKEVNGKCHTSKVENNVCQSCLNFFFKKITIVAFKPEAYFASRKKTCQKLSIIDLWNSDPMFRLAALSQNRAECPFFRKNVSGIDICIQNVAQPMVCSIVKGHRDSNEVPAGKITSPLCLDRHLPCQNRSAVAGWKHFEERDFSSFNIKSVVSHQPNIIFENSTFF